MGHNRFFIANLVKKKKEEVCTAWCFGTTVAHHRYKNLDHNSNEAEYMSSVPGKFDSMFNKKFSLLELSFGDERFACLSYNIYHSLQCTGKSIKYIVRLNLLSS